MNVIAKRMSPAEFARFVQSLSVDDVGRYGAGGFGVKQREWFVAMVKAMAKEVVRK